MSESSSNIVNIRVSIPEPLAQASQVASSGFSQGIEKPTPATPGVPDKLVDEAAKSMAQVRGQQAEIYKAAFKPLPPQPQPQPPDVATLRNVDPADNVWKDDIRNAMVKSLTSGHSKHGGAGMDVVRGLDATIAEYAKLVSGKDFAATHTELFNKYAEPVRKTNDFWQKGGANGILASMQREFRGKIDEIKKPYLQEFATQKAAYAGAVDDRDRALRALGLPVYDLQRFSSFASNITQPMFAQQPVSSYLPAVPTVSSKREREEEAPASRPVRLALQRT